MLFRYCIPIDSLSKFDDEKCFVQSLLDDKIKERSVTETVSGSPFTGYCYPQSLLMKEVMVWEIYLKGKKMSETILSVIGIAVTFISIIATFIGVVVTLISILQNMDT